MTLELIAAYRRAHYRVFDPDGEFVMQIDMPCPGLARCHARHGVDGSCFISAWNPGSVVRSIAENSAAAARLRAAIAALGLAAVPGQGEDPGGLWVPEASLLVPGIDAATALQLAREFGQAAIVFAEADAVPKLLIVHA